MTLGTAKRRLDVEDVDFFTDDPTDLVGVVNRLRSTTPLAWVRYMGEPSLMVTPHELVSAGFRDELTLPSHSFYELWSAPAQGKTIQCMTGDEHRINRSLVYPAFRARLMPDYVGPILEPVAHELIDRFADRGEADLVAEFTKQFPFAVITRLLGLPASADGDSQRWALGLMAYPWDPEGSLAASTEFVQYLKPIVEQRRAHPGQDLISALVTCEVEGHGLTDEEIFAFVRLLFPAGADTTYLGLGNVLLALLTHRDELAVMQADLDGEARWAVEEGMRWQPPVGFLSRRTVTDVEWHGMAIPAQTYVLLCVVSANRDPAMFAEPDRFDLRRHPQLALTFGLGMHFCLGAHLARAEMEVALRVLFERLPKLRLSNSEGLRVAGSILRGPGQLPVRFD